MSILEQQAEYNRCSSDPIYFINKYTYFYKYSPLLADFKLYGFQEEVIDVINTENKILINSARQMGISTIMDSYMLWKLNFTPNYSIASINTNGVNAIRSLNRIKDSYDRLPDYIRTKPTKDNKKCLELENGSTLQAYSANTGPMRGKTIHLVFLDNASFTNNDTFYMSMLQSLTTDGKLVIASTLYKSGLFLDLCRDAESGDSAFKYIRLPYYLHPRRDRLWRSNEEKILGVNGAKIEYDCTHYYVENGEAKPIIED